MSRKSVRHNKAMMLKKTRCCIWCGFRVGVSMTDSYEIVSLECPVAIPAGTRRRIAKKIMATFEHLHPKAHGGTAGADNGGIACLWCNNWRGTEDALVFAARITALVAAKQHPRQVFRETGVWPLHLPPRLPSVWESINAPRG